MESAPKRSFKTASREAIAQGAGTPVSNATGILSTLVPGQMGSAISKITGVVDQQVGPQGDKGNAPKINHVLDEAAQTADRTQRGYDLASLSGGTSTLEDARTFAKSAGLTDQYIDGLMSFLSKNLDVLPKFAVATQFGDLMTVALAALLKESFGGAEYDPMPGVLKVFGEIKAIEDQNMGRLDVLGIVSRALRDKKNPVLGTDWNQDLGRDQLTNSILNNTPLSKTQSLNAIISSLLNPNRPTKALLDFALRERNMTQQQAISTMMDVAALKAERDIRYNRKLREFWKYIQDELPHLANSPTGQHILSLLDQASLSLAKIGAWQDVIGLGGGATPLHVMRSPGKVTQASSNENVRVAQLQADPNVQKPHVSITPLTDDANTKDFTAGDAFVKKTQERLRGIASPEHDNLNSGAQKQLLEAQAAFQDLDARLGIMESKGLLQNIEADFEALAKIGQTGKDVNLGFNASGKTTSGNLVYVAAAQRLLGKIKQAESLLDQYTNALGKLFALQGSGQVSWSDTGTVNMAQIAVAGEVRFVGATAQASTPSNNSSILLSNLALEKAKNSVRSWKFTLGVMTTMISDYALIEKNMAWIAQQQLRLEKNKRITSTLQSLGYPQGAMFGRAVTNVLDANSKILIKEGDPMPNQAITDITEQFKDRYKSIEGELKSALGRAEAQAKSLGNSGFENAGQLADMMVQHLRQRIELAEVAYAGAVQEQASPTGKAMEELFQRHSDTHFNDWNNRLAMHDDDLDKFLKNDESDQDNQSDEKEVDATTIPELFNSLIPGYGTMIEKSPKSRNMTLNQVKRKFRRKRKFLN